VEHGFDYLKVASCSLTDWPLAEKIAATSLPLILSTAGEPFEEIDRIVSFYQHREKRIALMHCVGEYPTAEANLQLNQIDLLRGATPTSRWAIRPTSRRRSWTR
jgi:sialic acid synthase SpsE